jgi:hypothetical protein
LFDGGLKLFDGCLKLLECGLKLLGEVTLAMTISNHSNYFKLFKQHPRGKATKKGTGQQ